MSVVLEAVDLTIGYLSKKNATVAKEIHLGLHTNKLISLVGANGAGKSTLLKTLTGIIKPLAGSVHLMGRPVESYTATELARMISIVLTDKLPPSNLTVYELVALGRQPYTNWMGRLTAEDRNKVEEAIKLTQISGLIDKKHYEISDGQLQKVLVARALAQDTPCIILDEPTTHLDLLHKVSLFKLLRKLSQETQKCILFSTHDIDMAIQLSDEMLVMMEAQCIQDQPCNLINRGVFPRLFQDEQIQFDAQSGKFIIR